MKQFEFKTRPQCRTLAVRSAGFTLIEILIAIAIIAILSTLAYPMYTRYIDRARVTIGISTLETLRKSFEDFNINFNEYPPALDMTNGQDGAGRIVLNQTLLDEFRSNLHELVNYVPTNDSYTLTARAVDSNHTLLVLKPGSVVTRGTLP